MYGQSKLPLENDTGATNRSNRNDIAHADWADYKCAVLIQRSDFEAVYFTAYIYSKNNCWSVPVRYQILNLPKTYQRDRRLGRVQTFNHYRQYTREIPTKDRKIELQYHLLRPDMKKFLKMWPEENWEQLQICIRNKCAQLIEKLNLGIVNEARYVTQKGVALPEHELLTGWVLRPDTGQHFFGIRKRRLFQNYLGEPIFHPKKLESQIEYRDTMAQLVDYICRLWKNHPSILPIVAYGVLSLLYTPPKPERREGVFVLDFSESQPCALVVTGCHRDSLAALRAFADTNFAPEEMRQRETWLDSILRDGNFFEPYVKKGLFQNMTQFENNPSEELEPGLVKRWEESHQYGLHPVVWMPKLKRTRCKKEQMKQVLRVQVRTENGPLFRQLKFRATAVLWREILRRYIIFLGELEVKDFRSSSLRIESCCQWRETVELSEEEKRFLQINADHQSVAFAFGQLLRWFEQENFIERDDTRHLIGLLVQELRTCEKLFNESELDRLHRYFDPIMAGEYPAGKKEKPPYLFWNGQERRTRESCLYIEANRWEEHYRKKTNSEASNTELMKWLKPYLVQRPDKKALGMQRVYRNPDSGETKKVYVLCILKKRFLSEK